MLVKDGAKVDLENAVYMTEDQRQQFIEGCRAIFDEVTVQHVSKPERNVDPDEDRSHNEWTVQDHAILLEYFGEESADDIAEKMDERHSARSVNLKGGKFVQKFTKWWSKQGKTMEDIDDYLEQVKRYFEEVDE